jgi:hypothetical protein
MIQVKQISDDEFEVSLEGPPATKHVVRLSEAYYRKLTQGRVSREDLITRSFEFLLERESNTSILRSFELPVIGRYFPEYEREIQRRLG